MVWFCQEDVAVEPVHKEQLSTTIDDPTEGNR